MFNALTVILVGGFINLVGCFTGARLSPGERIYGSGQGRKARWLESSFAVVGSATTVGGCSSWSHQRGIWVWLVGLAILLIPTLAIQIVHNHQIPKSTGPKSSG